MCFNDRNIVILIICITVAMTTSQTTLQIGWLVPWSSHPTANFPFNASTSIAALALGIETIQNESLLQDYTLKYVTFRPRGYKTFLMLNSDEHEILNAHKYKNIEKFGF